MNLNKPFSLKKSFRIKYRWIIIKCENKDFLKNIQKKTTIKLKLSKIVKNNLILKLEKSNLLRFWHFFYGLMLVEDPDLVKTLTIRVHHSYKVIE